MPVHSKCFRLAQWFTRSVPDIKGDLLIYFQIPGHTSGIAHPLRMRCGLFSRDIHASFKYRLRSVAILRFHFIWGLGANTSILQREEAVKLTVILAPETGLDHQIRRAFLVLPVFGKLTEDWHILGQFRIADEELDKEWFLLSCLLVLRSKGMPPPVIAETGQWTVQHKRISVYIVLIEHISSPICPKDRTGATSQYRIFRLSPCTFTPSLLTILTRCSFETPIVSPS